jgi:hypothetical protein
MSRSIHTTRKSVSELERRRFESEVDRSTAIKRAKKELERKRLIKRQVVGERRSQQPHAAPTSADSIPVLVEKTAPYVYHAASEEDVREILRRIPSAAVEGISEIRLSLGAEFMLERRYEYPGDADPLVGRIGSRLFPGVYAGTILGSFCANPGRVFLYAYVLNPDALIAPRGIIELYLRIHALKTLLHEVAHFHDHICRVHRGRWLADRKENLEWYAEKMEHQWTADILLPYLKGKFPSECKNLTEWVRRRGGISLSLDFFSGDTRRTERNGLCLLKFSTSSAFEDWLGKLPLCTTTTEAYLALAWKLHYADKYDECLTVLNNALAKDSGNAKVRACRADTLIHLDRLEEALVDADFAIERIPTDRVSWRARANILERRKDWSGVLEFCARWGHVKGMRKDHKSDVSLYQAIAYCALGQDAEMERCIAGYPAAMRWKDTESIAKRMPWVRRRILRRAGRPVPELPSKRLAK